MRQPYEAKISSILFLKKRKDLYILNIIGILEENQNTYLIIILGLFFCTKHNNNIKED